MKLPPGDVLVKFEAGWCEPCRRIAAPVRALCAERGVRLVVVDVDRDPTAMEEHGVSALPTFVCARDGAVVPDDRVEGADLDEVVALLARALPDQICALPVSESATVRLDDPRPT